MSETTNLKLFKHDNPATNENQFDVTKALNNNWDKIDDFAETTNTKITENQNNIKSLQTDNTTNKKDIATLKSDNTTNKQDIANLKTENEELKAENERLNQDLNALPSNEAEGEYITLTDSADSRFNKFKVLGKSEQKTRSGKNILDINANFKNINCTYEQTDRAITVTRGDIDRTSYITIGFPCKANTNYKFFVDCTILEDTITYSNSNTVGIRASTGSSDWLSHLSVNKELTTKQTIEGEFNSGNYTQLYFWLYPCSAGGIEGSVKVKYEDMMVVEASVEDDSYEAYGAMPSPKFPSEIINFTGSINLFDGELETGSISTSTGENVDGARVRSKNYIEIPVNTSRLCFIRTITGGLTGMRFYDKNKNFLSSYNNTNRELANVQWFDVPQNTKYVRFVEFVNNLNSKIKITTDLLSYKYSEHEKGAVYIKNTSRNFINQDEIGNYNSGISYISTLDDNSKKTTANLSNSRDAGTFLKLKKNTQYIVSLDIISITTENGSVKGAVEIMGHKFNTDTNIFGTLFKQTTITSASIGQRFSTTFNSGDYDFWTLHISGWYGSGNSGILVYKDVQVEEGSTATDFVDGSQEFEFPLQEGQKLFEGSYLANDGIHHKRKQFVVDGTEEIYSVNLVGTTVKFNLAKSGSLGTYWDKTPIRFCNIYGTEFIKKWSELTDNPELLGVASYTNQLKFGINNNYIGLTSEDDLETRKTKVSNWLKDNNIVVEEEVDEYVEAYTDNQKKSHDKIEKEAKSYKTVTNIFSTNEVSPKFEVEYRQDIKSLIINVSQAVLNNA